MITIGLERPVQLAPGPIARTMVFLLAPRSPWCKRLITLRIQPAAACDGVGITLESTLLAEREIASRRLVTPLADRSVDIHYVGHHRVFPRAGRQRRPLRTFVDWITSELAQTDNKG